MSGRTLKYGSRSSNRSRDQKRAKLSRRFGLIPEIRKGNRREECLIITRDIGQYISLIAFNFTIICMDDVRIEYYQQQSINNATRHLFLSVCILEETTLQGMGTALSFPATGLIASQWSTVRASGTFMAILSCHAQVNTGDEVLKKVKRKDGKNSPRRAVYNTFLQPFAVGPISDRATFVSDRLRVIFFAVFSQGLMAMAIFSLATHGLAQLAYTLSIVFSGVNVVGTIKCAQLVARQHVHIVMTVISFILCITILLIPVAVNVVCPDNTPEQVHTIQHSFNIFLELQPNPYINPKSFVDDEFKKTNQIKGVLECADYVERVNINIKVNKT
uniref:Solute carrier family 40 protein n=1 Tax=Angiostrongylus cantonensis TaxID=6313 RepID=A0A158P6N6_ANGCA